MDRRFAPTTPAVLNRTSVRELQRCMKRAGHTLTKREIHALLLANVELLSELPIDVLADLVKSIDNKTLRSLCTSNKRLAEKCRQGRLGEFVMSRKKEVQEWPAIAAKLSRTPGFFKEFFDEDFDLLGVFETADGDADLILLAIQDAFDKEALLKLLTKTRAGKENLVWYKQLTGPVLAAMYLHKIIEGGDHPVELTQAIVNRRLLSLDKKQRKRWKRWLGDGHSWPEFVDETLVPLKGYRLPVVLRALKKNAKRQKKDLREYLLSRSEDEQQKVTAAYQKWSS